MLARTEVSETRLDEAVYRLLRAVPADDLMREVDFTVAVEAARTAGNQAFLTGLVSALNRIAAAYKVSAHTLLSDQLSLMAAQVEQNPLKIRRLRKNGIAHSSVPERAVIARLKGPDPQDTEELQGWQAETDRTFSGGGLGVEKVILRHADSDRQIIQKTFIGTRADLKMLRDPASDVPVPLWLVEPYLHLSGMLAAESLYFRVPSVLDVFCTDAGRLHVVSEYVVGVKLRETRLTSNTIRLAARALGDVNKRFLDAPQGWLTRLPEALVTSSPYLEAITSWWRRPYDPVPAKRASGSGLPQPCRALAYCGGAPFFEARCSEAAADIDDLVAHLPEIAASVSARPKTVCHMDLHFSNMPLTDDRILFLDWGNAAVAPLGMDMGKLLGEIAVYGGKKFSEKKIHLAIKTYLDTIPQAGTVADIARISLLVMLHWHLPRTLDFYRVATANDDTRSERKYDKRLTAYIALTRYLLTLSR